ncbi:hypothetical protein LJB42_002461 [Komagataella kurtzmanii]|nr:hypothetical protein LJB42_002461 [Komagataella kurtzmanii]
MLSRSLIQSTKTATRNVRFASTNASKQSIVEKVTNLSSQVVYWGKVSGEIAKQVYVKEGLSPPTTTQIQSVYQDLYKKALESFANPQAAFQSVKESAKNLNKDIVLKYGAYGIQLVGLFSLGEIIGRRQIVGYPSFGPKAAAHH